MEISSYIVYLIVLHCVWCRFMSGFIQEFFAGEGGGGANRICACKF